EEVLRLLYDAAEFANMSVEQQTTYESFMRTEIDIIAEKTYARESGFAEGRAEGKAMGIAEGRAEGRAEGIAEGRSEGAAEKSLEIAKKMALMGFRPEQIAEATDLSLEEVAGLQATGK
ncbi:MAG: hypothetical protein IJ222_00760, partial [Bacteroidales bacterium]|nr:hypothetical protein [Bacteroidales bacterium]